MQQQSRPERRVAWLILLLGIAGIVLALLWDTLNVDLGRFTVNPMLLLVIGIVYVLLALLLLLFFARRGQTGSAAQPQVSAQTAKAPQSHVSKAAASATRPLSTPMVQPSAKDDLTVIEGIGPKSQEALNKSGVYTFAHVAALSPEELYRIVRIQHGVQVLSDAAATWQKQAEFLARGDIPGFKAYVDQLVAGRRG